MVLPIPLKESKSAFPPVYFPNSIKKASSLESSAQAFTESLKIQTGFVKRPPTKINLDGQYPLFKQILNALASMSPSRKPLSTKLTKFVKNKTPVTPVKEKLREKLHFEPVLEDATNVLKKLGKNIRKVDSTSKALLDRVFICVLFLMMYS